MPEKMLFQIAIERILDRLARLRSDDAAKAIDILRNADGLQNHDPARHKAARTLLEMLFPELAAK